MATNRYPEPPSTGAPAALAMLGDDTRRTIVEHLAGGPLSVGELADRLPVSRPAVSQHLAALKRAGLVTDRAEGTRRIYRLDPAGLQLLRTYLDRMWASALEGFQDAATLSADHDAAAPADPADPADPTATTDPEATAP